MTRSRSLVLLVIALATITLCFGCGHRWAERHRAAHERAAQQRIAEAEAQIRATDAAMTKAAQAKDLDKSVAGYAPDAVMFLPNTPPVHGIVAIRKVWQSMLAAQGANITITPIAVDVARSADLAWERATYSVDVIDKKGKSSTQTGEAIIVWKKQADGSWKVVADVSAGNP
ncbi:MAG: DUF4440 domain-containing protein [Acidobacteriia bacterium]|nr:DUF4440 domain-containing protein [Terriglobia bacterium]